MNRSRGCRGQGPRELLPHPFRTMKLCPFKTVTLITTIITVNAGQSDTCLLMNSVYLASVPQLWGQ